MAEKVRRLRTDQLVQDDEHAVRRIKRNIAAHKKDWLTEPVKAISEYRTSTNMPVMVLLYPSDPDKDPETEKGLTWREAESSGYPGGLEGPKWLQEMEGRFDVRDTARVWADFDSRASERICPPFDVRQYPTWTIICGYDYGWPNPSALIPFAFDGRRMAYQIDEIYGTYTVGELVREAQQRWWWDRVRTIIADPNIWTRTQQQLTGPPTAIADLFENEYHVFMEKGQNFPGSDAAYVALLDSVLWSPNGGKFKIFSSCVNTIKEYRLLAWRKESQTSDMERPLQMIASKNVHAFDASKYAMLDFWQGVATTQNHAPEGSVNWWLKELKRTQDSVKYVGMR